MMTPKDAEVGKKYVIQIVGLVNPGVAECITPPELVDGTLVKWPRMKVLNAGMLHDATLKECDYLIEEEYDPARHGPIETGAAVT